MYKEGDLVQISINKPASSQTTAPKAEPKLTTQVISPSGTADDEEDKPLHRIYGPHQKDGSHYMYNARKSIINLYQLIF